ncbi:GH92 family glycosyl hydrolase [Mangrovivirga cuniculi]|uniref:Alpha-mannosidase n=1 Tax=Mangrovivirga cuniculi TaxID=2715131 RepID=A0A4D7JLM8_9BACT|nr:GH92 family glycosyl hydrolase [Mangrovivirga cuniculi]QCK16759.1 alpha-mannosidase [Mangrovivirga cuniculi]
MKNRFLSLYSSVILTALAVGCTVENNSEPVKSNSNNVEPIERVNVFTGTGGHGHTYPGATTPFGMIQLSPDNGTEGWDWCSGYHYSDSTIAGFSHLHLSGTGIGDLCDISVMPRYASDSIFPQKANFSHDNETAKPGYYSVTFNNGIKAEMTATDRLGIHRYTFPENSTPAINFDLGFAINWDKTTGSEIEILNDSTIVGLRKSEGWAKNQQVYFAAVFSQPFSNTALADSSIIKAGRTIKGKKVLAYLQFEPSNSPLILKVAISSASRAGALKQIQLDSGGISFDNYLQKARGFWSKELNKINATLYADSLNEIFYSALYHSTIAPNLYSDLNDEYKGANHEIWKAEGFNRYTVFSLWDTFRAVHPLFTITQKEKLDDFLMSILSFYDEYGLLPVWALEGSETNTMTGYHAIPVLTDAILKGHIPEHKEKAFEAMLASANQNIRGTDFYREFGYVPADKDGWSVTKTLEYAYDDWCIAQVARYLGNEEIYNEFMQRATSYRELFDEETLFMRGKNSDGSWVSPFDPFYSEHGFEGIYIEGTAWQHSWFVPHDVQGLINLFGSNEKFEKHLDSTFNVTSEMTGENVSVDISGLIGQYAHGNEPSHHIAYLYNYIGKPWKTQERVREIMKKMYSTGPDGLAGNDDCGQMSAWYIFSALGFYPVNPADGNYIIGSPLVNNATIKTAKNTRFNIYVSNNSAENIYVEKVFLNGKPLDRSYITHDEIMEGSSIEFVMSNKPNKNWATEKENFPPSMTKR